MRRQRSKTPSSGVFLLSSSQAFRVVLSLILFLLSIGWTPFPLPLLATETTPNAHHRRDAHRSIIDSFFSYSCVVGARADEFALGNSTSSNQSTQSSSITQQDNNTHTTTDNTTSEETPTVTSTTQTPTTSTSTPTTAAPSSSPTTSSTTAQAPSTTTAATTASSPATTSTSGNTPLPTSPSTSSTSGPTTSTASTSSSTTVTRTPNPTNTPTATTSAAAPEALTKASSLNPAVVGISVVVLVVLFTLSFYFIVMWPRTAMRKYRRSFESHDGKDGKEVKIYQLKSKASGGGGGGEGEYGGAYLPPPTEGSSDFTHIADTLYGGAPLKRKAGDGALSKIPTFKDIEAAAAGGADYREL